MFTRAAIKLQAPFQQSVQVPIVITPVDISIAVDGSTLVCIVYSVDGDAHISATICPLPMKPSPRGACTECWTGFRTSTNTWTGKKRGKSFNFAHGSASIIRALSAPADGHQSHFFIFLAKMRPIQQMETPERYKSRRKYLPFDRTGQDVVCKRISSQTGRKSADSAQQQGHDGLCVPPYVQYC